MTEHEIIKKALGVLHAPTGIIEEIYMKDAYGAYSTSGKKSGNKKIIISVALAACLIFALCTAAAAIPNPIFGWGKNSEIYTVQDGDNISHEVLLHTDNLTEPVSIEKSKIYFIVNNEHINITHLLSEKEAYIYQYTDDDGIIHFWLVGLNSNIIENYGYAEYMYSEKEGWLGGYSARTNIDRDGKGPLWLESGKDTIGIPW